ncbi:hypothetical protein N7524_011787 [Penicillium chrysogenum]|nr:hypothetical protein N7524_011787 [Penicillium chrysogenum]
MAMEHFPRQESQLRMAQTPLKALLGLHLSKVELANNTMLPGPTTESLSLINICQGLKESDLNERTLQALAQSQILAIHAQEMVEQFTDGAQEMLSLLAWHFDPACVSITVELLRFLSRPHKQLHTVCKHIYPYYPLVETFQEFEKKLGLFLKMLPRLVSNCLGKFNSEIW